MNKKEPKKFSNIIIRDNEEISAAMPMSINWLQGHYKV